MKKAGIVEIQYTNRRIQATASPDLLMRSTTIFIFKMQDLKNSSLNDHISSEEGNAIGSVSLSVATLSSEPSDY